MITPFLLAAVIAGAVVVALWQFRQDQSDAQLLLNVVEDRTLTRWITVYLDRGRDEPTPEEDFTKIHEWVYARRHEIDRQGYEITCQQMMQEFDDIVRVDVSHGGQHIGCSLRRRLWT